MVGEPDAENRLAIETYGSVPVLGEIPVIRPLTEVSLKEAALLIDSQGALAECFA